MWAGGRAASRLGEGDYADALGMQFVLWLRATELLLAIPLARILIRRRRAGEPWLPPRIRGWRHLRLAFHGVFLSLLLTTLAVGLGVGEYPWSLRHDVFNLVAMAVLGGWCFLVLRSGEGRPGQDAGGEDRPVAGGEGRADAGWLARADVIAANLWVALVLAEAAAGLAVRYWPSPLLVDAYSTRSILAANRGRPGASFLGYPFNRRGYYDEEFFPARPGDRIVALLGDSFARGLVPYPDNFVTVGEGLWREGLAASPGRAPGVVTGRVAIHNFGIPMAGMNEYAYLLQEEVEVYHPDRIVLCLYVGNDIDSAVRLPVSYRYLQDWLSFRLLRQWMRARGGTDERTGAGSPPPASGGSLVSPGSREKYEESRSLHSPASFLRRQRRQREICHLRNASMAWHYRNFLRALEGIQARAGARLLVVVIPDNFQVDDDLYRELDAEAPGQESGSGCRRDYPQSVIAEFCVRRGIPVLDLLPALREAQRSGTIYLPRDNHWNIRGNRLAGERLAGFLLPHPDPAPGARP